MSKGGKLMETILDKILFERKKQLKVEKEKN